MPEPGASNCRPSHMPEPGASNCRPSHMPEPGASNCRLSGNALGNMDVNYPVISSVKMALN